MVFECEVKGQPEPVIKWYREGIIIRSSPDYQIKCENGMCTLVIAEIFPEDSGKFKCVATNAEGTDSTESILRVIRECIINPFIMFCPLCGEIHLFINLYLYREKPKKSK